MQRSEKITAYVESMRKRLRLNSANESALKRAATGDGLHHHSRVALEAKLGTSDFGDIANVGMLLESSDHGVTNSTVVPLVDCQQCGAKRLPAYQFPNYPADRKCADCAANQTSVTKAIDRILTGTSEEYAIPHHNEILSRIAKHLGGAEGMATSYMESLEAAKHENPGSKAVLDHHRDLLKLVMQANEAMRINVDTMDEAELREYVMNTLLENEEVREFVQEKIRQKQALKLADGT